MEKVEAPCKLEKPTWHGALEWVSHTVLKWPDLWVQAALERTSPWRKQLLTAEQILKLLTVDAKAIGWLLYLQLGSKSFPDVIWAAYRCVQHRARTDISLTTSLNQKRKHLIWDSKAVKDWLVRRGSVKTFNPLTHYVLTHHLHSFQLFPSTLFYSNSAQTLQSIVTIIWKYFNSTLS